MSPETKARDEIVQFTPSIYERSLTFGESGNISVRIEDGWLMTPTGLTMGNLDPARLSKLDNDGDNISGDEPTREHFPNMAMYIETHNSGTIVHLHSTYSVAVSCCGDVDPTNVLSSMRFTPQKNWSRPRTCIYSCARGKPATLPLTRSLFSRNSNAVVH